MTSFSLPCIRPAGARLRLASIRSTHMIVLCATLTICSQGAAAAQSFLQMPLEEVQLDSHTRVGYEDLVWVKLNGSWPNVSCGQDWAYFNGKDNPHFVATVLAARATGATMKIYVDDALPKVAGSCQVHAMFF
jgi:hypothetical protein